MSAVAGPQISTGGDPALKEIVDILAVRDPHPYPFDNLLSTRQPILDDILAKFDGEAMKVVWMTGGHRTGKTAMSQRFMRMLHSQNNLAAAYLFPGTGELQQDSIVSTIRKQFCSNIPGYNDIWDANSVASVRNLVDPLSLLKAQGGRPQVVVLDGVQPQVWTITKSIIEALASSRDGGLSISVFLTSTEGAVLDPSSPGLQHDIHLSIFRLDDALPPLVRASLMSIKGSHPLKSQIPADWPPATQLQTLTERSSQNPLYGSTAIEYLKNSGFSPALRLTSLASTPFPLNTDATLFDRLIHPLYGVILTDAAYADPASVKSLNYLRLHLNEKSRVRKNPLTSTEFFERALGISGAVLQSHVEILHPLLVNLGGGQIEFVNRSALIDLREYLPATIASDWQHWNGEAHADIAVASLSMLSRGGFTSENPYHSTFFFLHFDTASNSQGLQEAIDEFDLSNVFRLGYLKPQELYFSLVPSFINTICRRFPAKKDHYISQLQDHIKVVVARDYQHESALLALTACDLDMIKYVATALRSSALVNYTSAKVAIVGHARQEALVDPLGLLSSFTPEAVPKDKKVGFLQVFPDSVIVTPEEFSFASLQCLQYLTAVWTLAAGSPRFLFCSLPHLIALYRQMTPQRRAAYELVMYYLSRVLPRSSFIREVGHFITDHIDLNAVEDAEDPFQWESNIPFEKDAARELKRFSLDFEIREGNGALDILGPVGRQVTTPGSNHGSDAGLPPSRSQSVAAVGDLPAFPTEPGSAEVLYQPRSGSLSSRSAESNQDAPAINSHHYTDREKLRFGNATNSKRKRSPPPLGLLELQGAKLYSATDGDDAPPTNRRKQDSRSAAEDSSGVHSSTCSCCSGCRVG